MHPVTTVQVSHEYRWFGLGFANVNTLRRFVIVRPWMHEPTNPRSFQLVPYLA